MLIGFQARFAQLVESGEKRQTIRALRHDGKAPRIGETLHLYAGLRTKGARKLGEAVCTETYAIRIAVGDTFGFGVIYVDIDGDWLTDVEDLAARDGFATFAEMISWFETTHGLPFEGYVIRW